MGSPAGLLSWAQYEEIRDVAGSKAYPIAVGYNYKGYRLLEPCLKCSRSTNGAKEKNTKSKRRPYFHGRRQGSFGGSHVARRLGLSKGYEFHPYHGWLSMREAGSRIPASWSEYWSHGNTFRQRDLDPRQRDSANGRR